MSEQKLEPKDHAERVALHRASVIGALTQGEHTRGELRRRLAALTQMRFRPPGAKHTVTYGFSTLERWYYAYKEGGLDALRPRPRADRGRARKLTDEQRALLRDVRREHPNASAPLIVRTLERQGLLAENQLSASVLRRFYRELGLERGALSTETTPVRLRWEAVRPHALWHGDVCHGAKMLLELAEYPLRIHGLLDDRSRGCLALEPMSTEREIDMLAVFTRALLIHGKPDAIYLDNGSTYRGDVLRLACERLGITLLHAQPYDPEARGKMERFWRTLREQCLAFLGDVGSLHDVRARLAAFVRDYQNRPHAGLVGDTPARVLATGAGRPVTEPEIRAALTVESRRRVRSDSTLSIGGKLFQVSERFLGGRVVGVRVCMLDGRPDPSVQFDGHTYRLEPVDPKTNGATARRTRTPEAPVRATGFDPNRARLDEIAALIRSPEGDEE